MTVELKIEVRDECRITIPNGALSAKQTEDIGKFFVHMGQEGYAVKSVAPIQREIGTQRDPETRTDGVRIVVAK